MHHFSILIVWQTAVLNKEVCHSFCLSTHTMMRNQWQGIFSMSNAPTPMGHFRRRWDVDTTVALPYPLAFTPVTPWTRPNQL